jgi:hypothetical protein
VAGEPPVPRRHPGGQQVGDRGVGPDPPLAREAGAGLLHAVGGERRHRVGVRPHHLVDRARRVGDRRPQPGQRGREGVAEVGDGVGQPGPRQRDGALVGAARVALPDEVGGCERPGADDNAAQAAQQPLELEEGDLPGDPLGVVDDDRTVQPHRLGGVQLVEDPLVEVAECLVGLGLGAVEQVGRVQAEVLLGDRDGLVGAGAAIAVRHRDDDVGGVWQSRREPAVDRRVRLGQGRHRRAERVRAGGREVDRRAQGEPGAGARGADHLGLGRVVALREGLERAGGAVVVAEHGLVHPFCQD